MVNDSGPVSKRSQTAIPSKVELAEHKKQFFCKKSEVLVVNIHFFC